MQTDAHPFDGAVAQPVGRSVDEVDPARLPVGSELGRRFQVQRDSEGTGDVVRPTRGQDRELSGPGRQVRDGVKGPIATEESDAAVAEGRPGGREFGETLREVSLDSDASEAERATRAYQSRARAREAACVSISDQN